LKQHHGTFHPKSNFDENIYRAAVPKKQAGKDFDELRREQAMELEKE